MLWNRAGKNLLKILAKDITQLLLCTFHRPPLAQGYWSRLKCCWLCSSAALHWMAEDSQTRLFQRCYPDSRFITQRILWFSTDSHNSELWAHVGAGSAHKEARVPVKNVSGWRLGGGGERHFTADFIKHSWWKLAELHGEATGKWDTISWLLKYGLYKAKGRRSGRTAVLMLRNRAQNCKKLLSIEFHTQLLSRDSQILFSAIPLAKGQISHDLHNFLNRINEIIFPSRQPFFFPPLC